MARARALVLAHAAAPLARAAKRQAKALLRKNPSPASGRPRSLPSLTRRGQAAALFRKNLSLQWTRRVNNACLVLAPCVVLILVLGIQVCSGGDFISDDLSSRHSGSCPRCDGRGVAPNMIIL
jgi:hypothetical protein